MCFKATDGMNDIGQSVLVPCNRTRILITDDEAPIRSIFRMILACGIPGCMIDEATNGLEAVKSFADRHYGVVLLDLKMPVMDGQTAYQKICEYCGEKGWEMPAVIFCTGFSAPGNLRPPDGQGDRFRILQKPVSNDALVAAVKTHVASV
jgi:CheY-like chemotaxis protein